ncbi:hypothetical protein ACET3Z_001696 [Daucus carota]
MSVMSAANGEVKQMYKNLVSKVLKVQVFKSTDLGVPPAVYSSSTGVDEVITPGAAAAKKGAKDNDAELDALFDD